MPTIHIPDKLVIRLVQLGIKDPKEHIKELVRKEINRLEEKS